MTTIDLGLPTPPPATHEPVPADGPLRDTFGRVTTDLRVSVTDRCNLRCTYCMPADGLDWLPTDAVLTTDEFVHVLTVAVEQLGIRTIRFTGGEPLLRRDLEEIISRVVHLPGRPGIAMTTNGLGLSRRAHALAAAGLGRVNVSVDTVDRDRFAEITRRDRLPDVLDGLSAAHAAGLYPIKVNAVVPTRADLERLPDLLEFCLRSGYQLRVIEQMPLDADHRWNRATMVRASEILDTLGRVATLLPDRVPRGAAPAQTWLVDGHTDTRGHPARVGVIASVTQPFCGDCDRTRLTADGALRNCLFAETETALLPILRSGSDDVDHRIAEAWRANAWAKRAGHSVNTADFRQPDRPMSAIGG